MRSLIQTPQNNLRVFKDRSLVYSEERRKQPLASLIRDVFPELIDPETLEDSFVRLLLQALNRSPKTVNHDSCDQQDLEPACVASPATCLLHLRNSNLGCECTTHSLDRRSVLGCILRGQLLGSVSGREALSMANFLLNKNPHFVQQLANSNFVHEKQSPHQWDHESLEEYYLRLLWQFYVSLTFKDCSIMMTMQRLDTDTASAAAALAGDTCCDDRQSACNLIVDKRTSGVFAVNLAVVDLDPKFPEFFAQLEKTSRKRLLLDWKPCQSASHTGLVAATPVLSGE